MDGGGADRWSAVADDWADHWGEFAAPAWEPLLAATRVGSGTRVVDVGCGTGELLTRLVRAGAVAAGVDPAPDMVRQARERNPGAPVLLGDAEHLPFDDDGLDVVLAVNALQFADDTRDALTEAARVLVPGGRVGLASWAEGARNDLDVVERAVAAAFEEDVPPDGPLRPEGGLEAALADAGLDVLSAGLVEVPWTAADDERLVRGVLFGEDPATMAELAPVVVAAAAPFRTSDGGYRLVNAFRYAAGRVRGRCETR